MVLHKMLFTIVYHTYFESKTEILVFINIFIDSKETGFLGQLSVCKMSKFDAVYKQRTEKG